MDTNKQKEWTQIDQDALDLELWEYLAEIESPMYHEVGLGGVFFYFSFN